ncbi:Oidioi.mRNA.OKI2018_I69.chr1.g2441.t1.cds [Oikopleura dioica]|uniref:Oidioi.mRNA.OKI2018_I69.chr1.g2441.t1.cds n=1 Tax=Oikopleura dioica TaxID=34765 RepID=A0ABN7SR45_OIKDI|nr:Oidioi.mRNA.OKI2018_I69.chr1.g2441.t1.cds [Oikopleura dioica]
MIDFFAKFGPTAAMGNVAGSIAVLCYGYITFCVGAHLYWMDYVMDHAYWHNWTFFGSFIAVVICEWIFLTLVMALSFFQANFIGCTCCCKDPSESGAIEPVNQAVAPIPPHGYPAVPFQGYPQGQPALMPVYGQPIPAYGQPMSTPYGQYASHPAPKEVDESSSDSSSSDSDSD